MKTVYKILMERGAKRNREGDEGGLLLSMAAAFSCPIDSAF